MDEEVQKELEALRGMVLTWKKSYLELAPVEGGGEYLALDFLEEIETHVYPYARRLYECNYLTLSEMEQFLDFCYGEVESLRETLR